MPTHRSQPTVNFFRALTRCHAIAKPTPSKLTPTLNIPCSHTSLAHPRIRKVRYSPHLLQSSFQSSHLPHNFVENLPDFICLAGIMSLFLLHSRIFGPGWPFCLRA
ncbi:hypothetical protein JAAARDRAFT_546397 [Jaapia argillacea MUCL 33604]|uniref:Uncharacterized protein n=1 Tax=Jaapia argillacea MUCL 33604 TaxID=933084 RepID=A0A067PIR8_9AGAM|nr:hypothetical protein JAAARDRAFT_546397 [Jaapia argillacea MUCL 33604]